MKNLKLIKINNIFFHADDYGRSKQISKKILNCLKYGHLNSVSIIVNQDQNSLHKIKKIKNIKKKLHLNLTELKNLKKYSPLSNLSFIKLLFLKKNRKVIFEEINSQIKRFVKIYKPKKLIIDGHEHVHLIPWIYNYLIKNSKKLNLFEIREMNERLIFSRVSLFFNPKYIRNLIAWIILKICSFFSKKNNKSSPKFFGLIHTGMQNEQTIIEEIKFLKNKNFKSSEILIHPGYTNIKEKKMFKNNYFDFYRSKKRKVEYALCFSKKIKKELNRT